MWSIDSAVIVPNYLHQVTKSGVCNVHILSLWLWLLYEFICFSYSGEIELSILRTDSVNVTWTIPSFVETEEYIIEYGLKSDNLNLTSSSVNSSTDTSLVNQTYSVVLDDLKVGTIYYMRVLAQYGYQNLYKRYSDVVAFRTLEEGNLVHIVIIPDCTLLYNTSFIPFIIDFVL